MCIIKYPFQNNSQGALPLLLLLLFTPRPSARSHGTLNDLQRK